MNNRLNIDNSLYDILNDYNKNITLYNNNIKYILENLIDYNNIHENNNISNLNHLYNISQIQNYLNNITREYNSINHNNRNNSRNRINNNYRNNNNNINRNNSNNTNQNINQYINVNTNENRDENTNENTNENTRVNNQNLPIIQRMLNNIIRTGGISFTFITEREVTNDEISLNDFITNELQQRMTDTIYNNNTSLISYDENNENFDRICPITHENFENGEIVTKINVCGHIFKTNTIKTWLYHNAVCPKCRFNIITQQYSNNNS